jgi:hypothetical protein
LGLNVLLGNYSVLAKHPGRDIGGGAIGLGMNRGDFNKSSMARGAFNLETWEPKSGVPDGYRNPYCWVMPQASGGLSARNNLAGSGAITLSMAGGVNGVATLSGSGSLAATLALIVSLVAALSGSGTISSAVTQAFLQLEAALSGSGSVAALRSALANAQSALSGSGTVAGTTAATALGELAASITVTGTGLTTANVASSVWSALAAANNDVGSMGEKLNDAGSASNPWTEVIESGYTAAQILRLIAAAIQGDATGLESGAPNFKGLDGITDRITGTYVTGTRTVTTRDAD